MKDNHSMKESTITEKAVVRFFLSKDVDSRNRLILASLIYIQCLVLVLCVAGVSANNARPASKVRITDGQEWHYFKGSKELPKKWNRKGFDAAGWEKGRSGIGYGNSRSKTYLKDMRNKYKRIHARREFFVKKPSAVTRMTLSVFCDGPFKAYLNGIEVMNYTIVQAPSGSSHSASVKPEPLDLTGVAHELIRGNNVLAIECSNDEIDSVDFLFSPSLEIIQE